MGAIDVFAEVNGMTLADAAARFAAAGMPVFPCVPGEKRPLVRRGFHDASTDPPQVAAWWSRWPAANIGIPTGAASGVEVVDVLPGVRAESDQGELPDQCGMLARGRVFLHRRIHRLA